jgi:hypothetical protein
VAIRPEYTSASFITFILLFLRLPFVVRVSAE